MKKFVAMLLVLALAFSLAACGAPAASQENDWTLRREKMTQEEADAVPTQLVTIETALGSIQGVQKEGYREFRGVKFATAERWEEAVAVTTPWEGVYDATAWGDRSMQFKGLYGFADSVINQFYEDEALVTFPAEYSEDSLNLNIWTPDNAKECPVLVYIHGGAFMTGSNTDTSTDGEAYANHGIITVSINYRLGPWANIYGDGYEGNLALTDQLTAIRWVRDNIADYGGDPSRITIMGESAGAMSVQNLLMTPLMEDGLIAGAIMMSGGGNLRHNDLPISSATMGVIWQQVKNGGGYADISEMKGLSSKELFEVWAYNLGELSDAAASPINNGVSLIENVNSALANGNVQNVPTMIGMLSEDMYPYSLYCAATEYGQKRAAAGGEPVYLYYFDRQQPGDTTFGAFHAADLYYAFGTLYRNWRPFDDVDYRIADNMIDYISNFVKTGDPNSKGLAEWKPATAEEQLFMHFGDEEAAMIAPDKWFLSDNQYNLPTFPYADRVKYPGAEGGSNTGTGKGTVISAEDLMGVWTILGWNSLTDGSFTGISGEQTFEFDGKQVKYFIGADLTSVSNYTFEDEYNIALRGENADPDGDALIWTIYLNEKGQLLIEDPTYNIAYVCVSPNSAKPITPEELLGEWVITGWDVAADGSHVPVDYEAIFTFEETQRHYHVDGVLNNTRDYYWKDDMTIVIVMDGTEHECGVYWGRDGYMMLEDPRYGIIYTCYRQGSEPGFEPGGETDEPSLPTPFYNDVTAASNADIQGTWNITGWIVKADGSFAGVQGQTFVFDGNRLGYYIGTALTSASAYYFEDQYNIGLRADGASQEEDYGVLWTLYFNDKGQLLIEDPSFSIIYVCELIKADKEADEPAVEPTPEPSAEPSVEPTPEPGKEPESSLPTPFYNDVTAASNADIQGTWNITGWIVKADGSFAGVQGQTFVFDGNRLGYYIGTALTSASAYYFEDQYNIGLRADGASQEEDYGVLWTLYFNDKGQLLIEDPSYSIIYVCEKA